MVKLINGDRNVEMTDVQKTTPEELHPFILGNEYFNVQTTGSGTKLRNLVIC